MLASLQRDILVQDQKEQAALERRRKQEAERRERILNPRQRTMGVDVNALEEQIREKKRKEEEEKKMDEAFAEQALKIDAKLLELSAQQEQYRRDYNQEVDNFRKTHQKYENRKEFDLNNPNFVREMKPFSPDDPAIGCSSAQVFVGEDLTQNERALQQKEQLTRWFSQQCAEKDREQRQMQEEERLLAQREHELWLRGCQLEKAQRDQEKANSRYVREYNKALADAKRMKNQQKKEEEQLDNMDELLNQINSDLLTENPAVARQREGQRVLTAEYKGMLPEELEDIRRMQEQQREEKQRQKEREAAEKRAWDKHALLMDKQLLLHQRQLLREKRESEKQLAQENVGASAEHRRQLQHLYKDVYSNEPSAEYFAQFGTSSR